MSQLSDLVTALEAAAMAELKKIEAVAENFVKKAEGVVEAVIGGVEAELSTLAPQALAFVLDEAPKLIAGTEKFGNAVTNLIQWVEGQGKGIVVQTAQMVVQQAYLAAKSVAGSL